MLIKKFKLDYPNWYCFVVDYECSIEVVGKRYFRAYEILQACKDWKLKERPEVF